MALFQIGHDPVYLLLGLPVNLPQMGFQPASQKHRGIGPVMVLFQECFSKHTVSSQRYGFPVFRPVHNKVGDKVITNFCVSKLCHDLNLPSEYQGKPAAGIAVASAFPVCVIMCRRTGQR